MKYDVQWSKTYYISNVIEVNAKSIEEAEKKVLDMIGDLEGSMQYDPNEDYVEAFELKETN